MKSCFPPLLPRRLPPFIYICRIPLEVESSSWLYDFSLHRAFHYHPFVLSRCKGQKTPNYHRHHYLSKQTDQKHASLHYFSHIKYICCSQLLYVRPTGDQEAAGSTPAEVGNILSWRLIMKYFLRSFFPFR